MTMHELSDDAKQAKQKEIGRLWLQQLASLMHDVGFRIVRSSITSAGVNILLRDEGTREMWLRTHNAGRSYFAQTVPVAGTDAMPELRTGGTIRTKSESLEEAQRRVFERCVKPFR